MSSYRLFLLTALAGIFSATLPQEARAEWTNSLKPKGQPAASLTLATNGNSDYVIVIPSEPTPQDRKAADELTLWLGKMTGVRFLTVADSRAPRETEISIGKTNRLRDANIPEAKADLAAEGYAIGVKGKRLYLLGGRKRGAINAVMALLEEDLGCRWYPTLDVSKGEGGGFPIADPECNRIPHTPTLQFQPVPRSYTPLFIYRAPGYTNAYESTWALRNRTRCGSAKIPKKWGGNMNWRGICHEMGRLVPPEEYFEKHPEYHALINGKRSPRQLCMTNPEVTKILTDELLRRLRKNPEVDFADVSPNDGGGHCACPKCDAMNKENNSPSASQIYFVNNVAEVVSKEFPHIRLSSAAYLDSKNPPTKMRCHKNVAIFLANDAHSWIKVLVPFTTCPNDFSEGYRQAVKGWTSICDTVLIWDYFCNFQNYLAPVPNLNVLEPSLRFYAEHGVKGVQMQGIGYHAAGEFSALRSWIIAKALWDPSLNVDALVEDFVWGYYREAAPGILEYLACLERAAAPERMNVNSICFSVSDGYPNAPYLTRKFIVEATAIFDRTLKMDLRPKIRRRVEVAKLPILYVKLQKGGSGTREPWLFETDEDYAAMFAEFKTLAKRERVSHYAEGVPMANFLNEKAAIYAPLPTNVVYDFYRNISEAKTENCGVGRQAISGVPKPKRLLPESIGEKVARDTLLVVTQSAPLTGVGDATSEVRLPPLKDGNKLVLKWDTCFSRKPGEGKGARFAVLIDGKEAWSGEQKERLPVAHSLDLSQWAGKTISLTLRVNALGTDPSKGKPPRSCWGRPQIIFDDGASAVAPGARSVAATVAVSVTPAAAPKVDVTPAAKPAPRAQVKITPQAESKVPPPLKSAPTAIDGFTPEGKNREGYRQWRHDATGIAFVELPGGEFEMGSPETEAGHEPSETLHQVTLSPFLIGKYEVTQAEYERVMDENPSHFKGPQLPVEKVSWQNLHSPGRFLERTGLSLPSDAQWEYACRAGQPGPISGTGKLDDMGWYSDNSDTGSGRETHPVGLKLPNQFGLHDMHGNVFEWVADTLEPSFRTSPEGAGPDPLHEGPPECVKDDPPCTACNAGFCALYRGGNFSINRSSSSGNRLLCRSASSGGNSPHLRSQDVGFRVALSLKGLKQAKVDVTPKSKARVQVARASTGKVPPPLKSTPTAIEGFTPEGKNREGYRQWRHDATGIAFVELPGGEFEMGSPDSEAGHEPSETLHQVTLSPFLIGKYEVTQAEYERVMDENPSHFKGPQLPVEKVSWSNLHNPDRFLERTGLSLPSDAQWEYACRAGQPGPISGTGKLDDMGWHGGNSDTGSGRETHPVGQKLPNQFGLHDMHGNVFEWVADTFEPSFYASPEGAGPDPLHEGPPECLKDDPPCTACNAGFCALYRGGHFGVNRSTSSPDPSLYRAACHLANSPNLVSQDVGFRVALLLR